MSLFLHQTTTLLNRLRQHWLLYMSLFLHQTTTTDSCFCQRRLLYMSLFLHQTTTPVGFSATWSWLYMSLFLHQTTTESRHYVVPCVLYMSLFLHQTTTVQQKEKHHCCCICLYSYIKPQHRLIIILYNKHLHALLLPKKWHLMWISVCKCTKKILTVKAPSALFSFFPFPKSSQYHHIAYLSHSIYLPYLFLAQWL